MVSRGKQAKVLRVLTSVVVSRTGTSSIGVVALSASPVVPSSLYEKASGSSDYLHLTAILRALQLGKSLNASNISILCSNEHAVKLANRDIPLESGSLLFPIYAKIRAMIYTYKTAEIASVSHLVIEPARRIAINGIKSQTCKNDLQKSLF